ncbi:C-type lectin domain family 10 member A isoform X2 [Fundulus heteroclitus]|uniref:C-type lectin domain family 10 member A isoform X2 n=1 Tax=Fundulus heteroclitus TaxID=8078 RepID=UPI00165BCE25|nr:C-type lectin domain family 10 member A isoform X2 [Fundulus heteroclitus]
MDRKAPSLDGSSENPTVSSSAEKIEEVDYVNAAGSEENMRAAPGHKFPSFSKFFPLLAAYWLILLVVILLHIHFHLIAQSELKQLKANQTLLLEENYNLTDLNKKLSSDLNIYIHNLTQQEVNLLKENRILMTELDEVINKNEELRREKKILTEQIETMEKTWNEQNVSRAQWSIDHYCPKGNNGRSCTSCQNGWANKFSSCYAYNDAKPSDQRNWEGAREDCRTKNSDLTVVFDQTEKDYVNTQSPVINGIQGYWIGLRAEGGKWRWIDGSELTNQTWIQQQPVDGQCVTSLQGREWRSVSCDEKNAWICEKKALSV